MSADVERLAATVRENFNEREPLHEADAIRALHSLLERLAAAERERDEARAQLRAATDIVIQAGKIAPGLPQLAGRFAIGDVAEARAERDVARQEADTLRAALAHSRWAAETAEKWLVFFADGGDEPAMPIMDVRIALHAALAATAGEGE